MTSSSGRTDRYQSLDVLRGIAILGTLATNIWIFTNPEGLIGYLDNTAATATPAGWAMVEAVLQQAAQGKFLGLLTLMFGIGLEIRRRSAIRRGRPWPGRYPWRAGLLLLDGALHYVLVAEFDVLMGYAVTGLVVAYVLATSERAQRVWMVIAATVHLMLLSLVTWALLAFPQPPRTEPLQPNPYADGSWWDLVVFRATNPGFRAEAVFIFALSVAMFLLGAQLVRRGVLEPRGKELRGCLMAIGAVGLALDFAIGLPGGVAGLVVARYATAPLVALGLLAVVVELVEHRPEMTWLRRRLNEVGRMALSSYILQNLVASTLCYGWGFGLATRLSPGARVPATVAVYLAVAMVVMLFAHLWLRRFSRGPVELAWLWCYDRLDKAIPAARPAGDEIRAGERSVR
jgi:uncharacterized protein